jgi:hypothetical protein
MNIKKGDTRTVWLIFNIAIKFPSLCSHKAFIHGCYCNWSERNLYKTATRYGTDLTPLLCPSYFCFVFGLFQIQKRAKELERDLTLCEVATMKCVTSDIKRTNFGTIDGEVICLDYP